MPPLAPTVCYLLRHAESAADDGPESDWPLTPRGRGQARAIVASLSHLGIRRIYSSPYGRAVDTVAPFAEAAGLEVTVLEDLRERKLSEGRIPGFVDVARRAWEDLEFALPACESGTACRRRVVAAVTRAARENPQSTVLFASHGNAIGLLLRAIVGPRFGYEQWRAMTRPALYRIECRDGELALDEGFEWAPGAVLS